MQRHWPWYLLITTAVLLVFGQACLFDFLEWDDLQLIVNNPYVNPPSWSAAAEAWTKPHVNLYIPVTYNAWAAIATVARTETADALGGTLNPYLFHTANLAVHLLAACLVYRILCLVTDQRWIAGVAATIWAIHPLQVEAVAWATGMKDVLSGGLALAAVLLYLSAAKHEQDSGATGFRAFWPYLVAAMLVAVATLAKPGVVGIPLIAIAMDLLLLGRPWRRVLACAWPLLLAVVPAAITTRMVQSFSDADYLTAPWTRPLIAGHALATYLQKIVWPDVFATDYGLTPKRVLAGPWGYLAWIVPAAVTAGILLYRPGRRWLSTAGLIFLAGVGPVLGFTPFAFQGYSTVADRYAYLSMLGVALAAAWFLRRLPLRWAATLAGFVCLALLIRAAVQTSTWRDNASVCEHTLSINPRSAAAYHNAGMWYMSESLRLRGLADSESDRRQQEPLRREANEYDERGVAMFQKALEFWPRDYVALNNIADYRIRQNQLGPALDALEHAIDIIDSYPERQQNPTADRLTIAKICINLKQYARAEGHLRKYLQKHPDNQEAKSLLAEAEHARH